MSGEATQIEATGALAQFAAGLKYDDVPERAREQCKNLLLDALACAAIARRLHAGLAQPFPNPPPRDAHGLIMAIWA